MIKTYIKNYEKNGKVIQVLNVAETIGNKTTYYSYFVNVSKNKGTVYLSDIGDKNEHKNN